MRSYALVALLASAAFASPVPQDIDWDAVAELDPVPQPTIPIVNAAAAATTISFTASAAAASVSSAVEASPTDTSLKMMKRAVDNSACTALPTPSDTAENFLADTNLQKIPKTSNPPKGYDVAYKNLQGSSQGVYGYMGYSVLSTYDVDSCATQCNAIVGCSAINIYIERDPTVDPTATCSNPPSISVIKCVYYGGPVTAASATNVGQYRYDFHVVITGSNGYVSKSIKTPDGYQGAVPLGNAAINAPLDCNGRDTYMGVKIFTEGPFEVKLCAAACSAQSKYNKMHPAEDGFFQTCQFFNTYILYKGTQSVGQYCSLYNETWPATFATNVGQYRGSDHYTIGYSYAFSNTTAAVDTPSNPVCANKASP